MYNIYRSYKDLSHPDHNTLILEDLSLEEAKEHCSSEESKEDGVWFDYFTHQ